MAILITGKSMTRLPESSSWEEEIELISRSERVAGGLDGPANRPLKSLANRTRYLKDQADTAGELIAEKVSAVKTFAEGATLESPREEILFDSYRLVWTGEFPKTVLAGSTPQGTGGIGAGRWAYTSDAVLRSNLVSSEGLKYIGFCHSVEQLHAISPDFINQKISLLGVRSGDVTGGDTFISVDADKYPADNQGVCFNSANSSFNWYRLRVLREKIIYLEDFSCVESTPDNLTDCTTQLKNAFTWA
ncbi:hypothetical protein D9K77_10910, partial [Klebsiella pneumoniae]